MTAPTPADLRKLFQAWDRSTAYMSRLRGVAYDPDACRAAHRAYRQALTNPKEEQEP